MSHQLILQWSRNNVRAVIGQSASGHLEISSVYNWSQPPEIKTPAEIGDWLKSKLTQANVQCETAEIVLPRSLVTMRNMHVPIVPDEELHEIVRFQAATRMSTPVDQLVLDYQPLPMKPAQESRNVIVVTLANKAMNEIQSIMEHAGLEIASIGLSAVSVAELWCYITKQTHSMQSEDTVSLIVLDADPEVEFTVIWRGHVIFSHTIKIDAKTREKSITAELNRSWIALQDVDSSLSINQACIIGNSGQVESVAEILEQRLGTSITISHLPEESRIQTSAQVDRTEIVQYGRLVGMLVPKPQVVIQQIDLCHPREPVQSKDYSQYRLPAAIGLVCLLLLCLYGTWQWRLLHLDAEIQKYQQRSSTLEGELKKEQPLYENYQQLQSWQQRTANYLHQWQKLNALSPKSDRVYLTNVDFHTGNRVIQMGLQARGHAKARSDVEQGSDNFSSSGYRVQPREIRRTNLDPKYPFQFELDIDRPITASQENKPK